MWKLGYQARRYRTTPFCTPRVTWNSPANFSPTGRQHRSKKSPCSTTGLSPGPDHDVDRRRQRPQPGSRVSTGSGRPAIPGTPAAAALKTTSSTSHVSPEPKESLKPEYIDPRPRHLKEGISELFIILINYLNHHQTALRIRQGGPHSAYGVVRFRKAGLIRIRGCRFRKAGQRRGCHSLPQPGLSILQGGDPWSSPHLLL